MRATRRLIALGALATIVALPASMPALAQSGTADNITHRQSVRTEMGPDGEVKESRVFTQLTVVGDGEVEVTLPDQSTRGLRNLDGFGRPRVDGDQVTFVVEASRDGAAERTVADHTGELPIELTVEYELDGEPIEPRDLVGRSGELTVTFTARNTTAEPMELRYFDGAQNQKTETVDVAVPFVGSVSLELDRRFVDIEAPLASVAGNGRGDTFVSWSMVLFEPVGSSEQSVSYTAQVTDAIVPDVVAQFLPVDSTSFGSLKSVQDTFGDVAEGLTSLTTGALIVDGNVKLLAAGAGQLLDGLGQLEDGAGQLAAGLNDSAVPGSRQLADGMGQARSGGRQLADGLLELGSGARQLSDGLGQARAGSGELAGGLNQLADGAGQLSGGLRSAAPGARQLADGLAGSAAPGARQLADGLAGSAAPGARQVAGGLEGLYAAMGERSHTAETGTVLGGLSSLLQGLTGDLAQGTGALRQLSAGLAANFQGAGGSAAEAAAGANTIASGAGSIASGAGQIQSGLQGAQTSLGQIEAGFGQLSPAVQAGLDAIGQGALIAQFEALVTGVGEVKTGLTGAIDGLDGIQSGAGGIQTGAGQLASGLSGQAASLGTWPATCEAAITAVQTKQTPSGLEVIRALACIAESVDEGLTGEVIPGVQRLQGAFDNPACDPTDPQNPANPCGIKQVLGLLAAGSNELALGIDAAALGAGDLATGLAGAAAGSTELAQGLALLEAGGVQLSGGARQAASGAGDLRDGLVQLDDGGRQLAAGADTAANGANDLANGLVQLDDGANQLADGLGDAGDGAGQLAEGLTSAREGGEQIADGTQALTDRGMAQIIEGASAGAETPALAVAHAKAADARGKAGDGLPYGTVDGAVASAVYQFELAGIGGPDDGPSTPVRAAATLAAFGVAGALGLGLRRTIA
jgi:putative membrane protein